MSASQSFDDKLQTFVRHLSLKATTLCHALRWQCSLSEILMPVHKIKLYFLKTDVTVWCDASGFQMLPFLRLTSRCGPAATLKVASGCVQDFWSILKTKWMSTVPVRLLRKGFWYFCLWRILDVWCLEIKSSKSAVTVATVYCWFISIWNNLSKKAPKGFVHGLG